MRLGSGLRWCRVCTCLTGSEMIRNIQLTPVSSASDIRVKRSEQNYLEKTRGRNNSTFSERGMVIVRLIRRIALGGWFQEKMHAIPFSGRATQWNIGRIRQNFHRQPEVRPDEPGRNGRSPLRPYNETASSTANVAVRGEHVEPRAITATSNYSKVNGLISNHAPAAVASKGSWNSSAAVLEKQTVGTGNSPLQANAALAAGLDAIHGPIPERKLSPRVDGGPTQNMFRTFSVAMK